MSRQSLPLLRLAFSIAVLALAAVPGAASAQAREYAYVAYGSDSGTVAVVDTVSQSVVTNINLDFGFPGVTPQPPDGRYLYVTGDSTEIAIIDTTTDQIDHTISVGFVPLNNVGQGGVIFQPPDGRYAWIIGAQAPDAWVIKVLDTVTRSADVIPFGAHAPEWVTFSRNGDFAVISEWTFEDHDILRVIFASPPYQTVETLAVGSRVGRVALNLSEDDESFVSTEFPPVVDVVSFGPPPSVVGTIDFSAAAPLSIKFAPSDAFAYVTGGYEGGEPPGAAPTFIWKVNADTREVAATIGSGDPEAPLYSHCCLFSADGARAYALVNSFEPDPLHLSHAGFVEIDTQSHTLTRGVSRESSELGLLSEALALSTDQTHAFVGGGTIRDSGFFWMVDLTGPEMQLETELNLDDQVFEIAMATHQPRPEALRAANVGSVAYVASLASVSVISGRTFERVAVIDMPTGARDVAFALTPDFYRAYVTSGSTVVPINLEDRTVMQGIQIDGVPQGLAITPDGSRIFVTNLSNEISVIDTANNMRLDPIPVGRSTSGIALTDYGGSRPRAYAAAGDVVLAIDLTNPPQVTTIRVPSFANGQVAITPDGKSTYVTGPLDGPLVIDSDPLSESFNTVVGRLNIGPGASSGIALSSSGAFIYVVNESTGVVSKVGRRSQVAEAQVDLGQLRPQGIALTDGGIAFVTNYDGASVSAIRTSSMTLIDTIPVERAPWGVAAR